ncbi:MAG: protein translocase subunit SecD [Actinomycetaceae bacterium]|nr:protein translocase subunit SecD [Actinomycetaceae bacterium]
MAASSKKKNRPLRTLITFVIVLFALVGTLAGGSIFSNASLTPKLALDLEGGTQIILTPVKTEDSKKEITDQDINQAIEIIRQRVDASGVAEAEINKQGGQNIVVSLPGEPNPQTLELVRSSAVLRFRPVLVAGAPDPMNQANGPAEGGASANAAQAVLAALTAAGKPAGEMPALDKDKQISIEEAAKLTADLNHDGQLDATLPPPETDHSDYAWVNEQLLNDFYLLDCTNVANREGGSHDEPGKPIVSCEKDGTSKYILGPMDLPGTHITNAASAMGTNQQGHSTGKWIVNLSFDNEGKTIFGKVSQKMFDFDKTDPTRNRFAVVLDGLVVSAPGINEPILDGSAQISGNFTSESAATLANQLQFGSLPLNFEPQSEQQISATLGSEHLSIGVKAAIVGLILVLIYLLWQYHALSIVSALSLILAGVFTYLVITILSWTMGYRLSLAGVVGLIIAVGTTMDSFVVYFERIRDEVRDGRPLVAAVETGWTRAKRTIVVSDMVNMVAAVVLYFLAVGNVKGFAFTLGLTTLMDLVIIFLFTHPMMTLLVKFRYFGEGRKFSGLDPVHLGASEQTYRGRSTQGAAQGKDTKDAETAQKVVAGVGSSTMSIARAKRQARLEAEASTDNTSDGPKESDALDLAEPDGGDKTSTTDNVTNEGKE